MTTATVKELPALLNELGVKIKAVQVDRPASAPEWVQEGSLSYRVSVSYDGRRTSLFFYCGSGVKAAPTAADVVYALAQDYDSSCYTLQEFGDEYGWHATTVQTHRAVKRYAAKFKRLFAADDVRQAIAESEY